jgi:clan AA aspartic protease
MAKKSTIKEKQLRSQDDSRKLRDISPESGGGELGVNERQGEPKLVGEVRANVKLTNAGDEVLVRRGLLAADKVRRYEADALVDTGAVRSVLPLHVVEQLGLAIVGKTRATYVNDLSDLVDITEMVGIVINTRRTTEEMLVLGSEVLIGQTVLESLDLLVDCVSRQVVGNPAHPDQPVIKIKGVLVSALEFKARRVVQNNL